MESYGPDGAGDDKEAGVVVPRLPPTTRPAGLGKELASPQGVGDFIRPTLVQQVKQGLQSPRTQDVRERSTTISASINIIWLI